MNFIKTNSISAGLTVHARTTATTRHLIFRRACLWTGFLAFATIAFGPPPAQAQAAVTEAWVHRFSNVLSNSTDRAVKVVRDAAGDIIVTGTTTGGIPGQDLLTIKYSGADGSVLWQQRYNGPANGNDTAKALAVDGSGNVVVTGTSRDESGPFEYYTAKYAAADGALLWEKRYSDGEATAVAVDGSGNVVVTGISAYDYYTAKYAAADGTLLWEKRYNGPANSEDFANAMAVDGSGNVVVTGYSNNGTNNDFYTAKYAAVDGALLWEKRYNGPANWYDQASAVAVDGSGNVVVTGTSSYESGSSDFYTAKYAAADGALLWEKRYGQADLNSYANVVAVDGSGNVLVTGNSHNGTNWDYYTAKYAAADGALLWEKRYNGPANSFDSASAVAVDASGNVVVTGYSYNGTNWDYYTAKYAAADGALLWEKRYNGPANDYDGAQAVAVDGSGNVVVTGVADARSACYTCPFVGHYYTAKYAAADGALLWEKRYKGSAPYYASAQAVAVDGSGNVAVTGVAYNAYNNGTSYSGDYYTAKYAAANGALLWEQRYNGPANTDDFPKAMAVDGSGNVVVTGSSYNTNYIPDYYTAKYAAADGTLLWEKRYNGPANSEDFANAMAVDGSGNVVVTGSSQGDFYTAKYASADGALLWEKRYNGPANSYDQARAVAVDGNGNVVVTGSSSDTNHISDYYTAKYAAADGALLWEKRYNGPANSYDQAGTVAVDGNGNVVVTGASFNGTNYDYYTAKYAAADGTLLWEKRSNGGGAAVAVDGSGNVVVTGSSYNGTNSDYYTDYYTAKYAAADGTLLWEKRYNGPANTGDRAQAVAVDGSGNVVVTGSSDNTNYIPDYYTAKYAAADGTLLWEKRYNGPANGEDQVGSYRSLALGPNGMVAITGSSSGEYATVVYREVLPPVAIELIPTGVRLRFTGITGRTYTIERASAVTGPWNTINTQTAPASGLIEYLDILPQPGAGFYRTVQP